MAKEKKYKSGLRLIVDEHPTSKSISFNMFIKVGSGHETEKKDFGISHFIEHMLFKNTKNYSTIELREQFDLLGVKLNAYTSFNETNFYLKTLPEHIEKCVELVSEIYFNDLFDEKNIEQERKVILEEIKMREDKTQLYANELANNYMFYGTNYGHNVIGTEETVKNFTKEQIENYFKKNYIPANLILSFAGKITMKEAEKLAKTYFQSNFKNIGLPNYEKTSSNIINQKPVFKKVIKTEKAQSVVSIAFPINSIYDEENYITDLFNTALSYGMSSPLFIKVREENGLVYNIDSYLAKFKDGGAFKINFSTKSSNVAQVVTLIKELLEDIKQNGFKEKDLIKAKNISLSYLQFKSGSNNFLATKNARDIAYYNKVQSLEDTIRKIKNLTIEQLNKKTKEILSNENVVITYVGKPIKENLLNVFLGKATQDEEEISK
jgi:predicted Zn-dependent peptidase